MLPDGNGLELFQQLRSRGMRAGVIVTTGSHDPAVHQQLNALKPLAVLAKPINLPDLFRAIDPAAA